MPTLQIPVARWAVRHVQPMTVSDWRAGAFHRRYRDARAVREWSITPRGGRGDLALCERQFNDGSCGAAEWDWTPPGAGSPVKVRFAAFGWTTGTAVRSEPQAVLVELLSSDT